MNWPQTIHASTIVLGEAGILIRGEAGVGKSTLARQILDEAAARRIFARLVADDRTQVEARHGRVLARRVEAVAGLIEVRGLGLLRRPSEPAAILRLVVDLSGAEPGRLPTAEERSVALCGILLPRFRARSGADLAGMVLAHISGLCDTAMTE